MGGYGKVIANEKKENETLAKFNNRFSKLHVRIPQAKCLGDGVALVFYTKSFDKSFGFIIGGKYP